jgi:hypothetical protein
MKFTFIAVLLLSFACFAQTPPNPPVTSPPDGTIDSSTSFTINLTPITLPGGHKSVTGIESGMSLKLTPNFDVRNSNLTGEGLQYFGGGLNYHMPFISKKLNGISPTINGLLFDFYLTGTVGIVTTPSSTAGGHWGERVGGGINYSINKTWTLGAEIQYAKLPGYLNNSYTVAVGPQIHF